MQKIIDYINNKNITIEHENTTGVRLKYLPYNIKK